MMLHLLAQCHVVNSDLDNGCKALTEEAKLPLQFRNFRRAIEPVRKNKVSPVLSARLNKRT